MKSFNPKILSFDLRYDYYFSAIVLISVVGMALANDIQNWFDRKFKKQNSNQDDYSAVKT